MQLPKKQELKKLYGWYLAATAIGLIISWSLHNVIAWLKNRPFMSRGLSLCYVGTIILAQPYWATEIYANFAYFNNINVTVYEKIRPLEALFRCVGFKSILLHELTINHPGIHGGFTQHATYSGSLRRIMASVLLSSCETVHASVSCWHPCVSRLRSLFPT